MHGTVNINIKIKIKIFLFLPERELLHICTSFRSVLPFKLLNNCPSVQVWGCSPLCTRASLSRLLRSSLSYAPLLHPHILRICNTSLRNTSSHVVLCFPTDLLFQNFPLNIVLEAFILPVLCCDPSVLFY